MVCAVREKDLSVTIEELKARERAALIESEESDNERPLFDRYLLARAAREQAEQEEATDDTPTI